MPVEFVRQDVCENVKCASTRLTLDYDGSGRRISKTVWRKAAGESGWTKDNVTHYTGIGTEVRENFAGSTPGAKVVVSLPEGLGRYAPGDASEAQTATAQLDENGKPVSWGSVAQNFEWYLKNHLGSTMLVFGTQSSASPDVADNGTLKAAYDYHATVVATRTKQQVTKCCPPFGEQLTLVEPTDKVTENFTGKGERGECCDSRVYSNWLCRAEEHCTQRNEKDDEIELNYFGARYLDPMLGLWVSVDAARQYQNPYLYAGNNPVMRTDPDGNQDANAYGLSSFLNSMVKPQFETANEKLWGGLLETLNYESEALLFTGSVLSVAYPVAVALEMLPFYRAVPYVFMAQNAVSSGIENGSAGVVASLLIDGVFMGTSQFLPKGWRSELVQGVANNFTHDMTNYIMSLPSEPPPPQEFDDIPTKSSSTAIKEFEE